MRVFFATLKIDKLRALAQTNEFEEQIRVPIGILQLPDLVHQQQVRCRVMLEPTAQKRITF